MGVNWIVEKGNTLWKVGVFEKGKIVSRVSFEDFSSDSVPKEAPEEIMLTGSGHWSDEEESAFYDLCGGNLFIFKLGSSKNSIISSNNLFSKSIRWLSLSG